MTVAGSVTAATHGADLAAAATAGMEKIGSVRLKPADTGAGGHLQPLQHLAAGRVDAPDVAVVALPGAVP